MIGGVDTDRRKVLQRLLLCLQRWAPKYAFWILNVCGWCAFSIMALVIYRGEEIRSPGFSTWFSMKTLAGFGVSVLLRYFLRGVWLRKGETPVRVLIVALSSFAAANLWYLGEIVITSSLSRDSGYFYPLSMFYARGIYLQRMFYNTWIFVCWIVLYFVIKFWLAWRWQRERAERLEMLAQQAQLKMLLYQLNPHFLFNALNSIRGRIGEERQDVRSMIGALSGFLRYSLDSGKKETVPLSEEIDVVRRYLEIEQARFEENLAVTIDVEPRAGDFPVPCFLIHPLVENAVKFGMQTSGMPLAIGVEAARKGDELVVRVRNSGSWVERDDHCGARPEGTGTGLSNLRKRLETAYPGNHRLDVKADDRGVLVEIEIGLSAGVSDEQEDPGDYRR